LLCLNVVYQIRSHSSNDSPFLSAFS
jgi:hypothetical protein